MCHLTEFSQQPQERDYWYTFIKELIQATGLYLTQDSSDAWVRFEQFEKVETDDAR